MAWFIYKEDFQETSYNKLIFPHSDFIICIVSLAIFHPHLSIRILSSAFFHPHFIIRIFPSAFYHPHFCIRYKPPSGPHFTETLFSALFPRNNFFTRRHFKELQVKGNSFDCCQIWTTASLTYKK